MNIASMASNAASYLASGNVTTDRSVAGRPDGQGAANALNANGGLNRDSGASQQSTRVSLSPQALALQQGSSPLPPPSTVSSIQPSPVAAPATAVSSSSASTPADSVPSTPTVEQSTPAAPVVDASAITRQAQLETRQQEQRQVQAQQPSVTASGFAFSGISAYQRVFSA